jgi:hypothetical protein
MPDTPYVPPAFSLSDAEQVSVIKESLDRAILTRQNILNKPKPTYDIDGQRFEWNEYLDILNKTISQLQKDLVAFDELYEITSTQYSV